MKTNIKYYINENNNNTFSYPIPFPNDCAEEAS